MKKCRNLANKLIMSFCAVVVAVSAFFYVPMEVVASEAVAILEDDTLYPEIVPRSINTTPTTTIQRFITYIYGERDTVDFDFSTYMNGTGLYKFTFDITGNYYCSSSNTWWRDMYITMSNNGVNYTNYNYGPSSPINSHSFTSSMSVYVHSDNPIGVVSYGASPVWGENPGSINFSFSYNLSNIVVSKVSSVDSEDYQNGYNAGYSEGEQAGYGSGYSDGYADGENSVDTGAIYDEAFQAGKDSVNTDSYYDAGYDAGYQVGVKESYEIGYESGYQSAMDRIDSWGADSTDYPVLVYDKSLANVKCLMEVVTNMPSVGYGQADLCNLDININPSHTYKIVFDSGYRSVSVNNFSGSQDEQFNYNIGLYSFPFSYGESFCFVQGSSLSSVFRLEIYDYSSQFYEIGGNNDVYQPWGASRLYNFESIDIYVYDYGPSGDTQNHIANQTDQLTNGFDSSTGDSVNSDFSAGLNDYQTAEDSLFATATTGMKDFTFFDFASVPAMVTGMSFVGSVMSSWFNQAGGASGVGIVLSILFSVMLVAMVLGLYRWYQSRGGKK